MLLADFFSGSGGGEVLRTLRRVETEDWVECRDNHPIVLDKDKVCECFRLCDDLRERFEVELEVMNENDDGGA
jgi:hypothetical protein